MNKPHIEYPCKWTYKIIGTDEESLREAVSDIMDETKYDLSLSRKSSGGKYVSLTMETVVQSEDKRNKIYALLGEYEEVKGVL